MKHVWVGTWWTGGRVSWKWSWNWPQLDKSRESEVVCHFRTLPSRWQKWDLKAKGVGWLDHYLPTKPCPCGCWCIIWMDGCGWAGIWIHLPEMKCVTCVAGPALNGTGHSTPLFSPFPSWVPGSSFSPGSSAGHIGSVYILFCLPLLFSGKQLLWTLISLCFPTVLTDWARMVGEVSV